MDFVSAIWGEKYAEAGSGLVRSFATHCTGHRLVVYTDVPEALPGPEESRTVSYHLCSQDDWVLRWAPYWRTGGRQMITKISLLEHRMGMNNEMPVMWVDADALFLENPSQDLGSSRSFKLLVDPRGRASTGFWGVGSQFQIERLKRWANERVEEQREFGPVVEGPFLQRWLEERRFKDAHIMGTPTRLLEAFCGDRIGTAGDGPECMIWKNGGVYAGPSRVVTLRLTPSQIDEHQRSSWRAFAHDKVREHIQELYQGG
jgi:hypothetical protein